MKNKTIKTVMGLTLVGSSLAFAFAMSDMSATMMKDDKMMMKDSMKMELKSNLMAGSKGAEVERLQAFLIEKGFLVLPQGVVKGYYGKVTKMAVAKFQKENGVHATGFFGPATRAKLNMSMVMVTAPAVVLKDIVDNAVATESVSTLVVAVKAAGLVDTLKSAGPFTVFAPTNAAFAALASGTVDTLLKAENKAQLTSVLTYHVVAGKYNAKDLTDGLVLKTVEGKNLTFSVVNNVLLINGIVTVELPNVESSNGVIHIINSVLMPR